MKKWTIWQHALAFGLTGFALKGAVALGVESLRNAAGLMLLAGFLFVTLDIIFDEIERRWPPK